MKFPRNPYLNRSMIRSPNAFYGRRKEAMRLATRIGADPPQSVAIVGDRRIGKSSLLSYIAHRDVVANYLDNPDKALFLFMDFQEELRLSVEGFIESVFRHLKDQLPALISQDPTPDHLQEVVAQLHHDGYRLILLLDEFDRVTRSSNFDADFFAYLRSLAGHFNVAFVTSTIRNLQKLCRTQEISDSPFFNIFTTIYLGPLESDEASDLICNPSASTPFPLEQHMDLILEIGGRFPFFLQMACSAAFEVMMEEGECIREHVAARFLEEAGPHFQFYWEQMGAVERAICNQLATGVEVEKGSEYLKLLHRGFALNTRRLFSTEFANFVRNAYEREIGEVPLEVQAQRARSMEEELDWAREMQMGLLPQEQPQVDGFDMAGRCEPATQVGGDFYTYMWLDHAHTRLAIVAVDVMGHGMQGAVTALRFSETLRYEVRESSDAVKLLAALNTALCGTLKNGEFVGCCAAVLDVVERRLEVAAAGYHPPLHYDASAGTVRELELGNLPLGIKQDAEYAGTSFALGKDDRLLFYSDGVIEAQDDREVLYGEERLQELLLNSAQEGLDSEALLNRLHWDVGRFSASTGQQDDTTSIAVRVTG